MRYFNKIRKKMLPDKNIDKFLSQLHILFKKHKLMIDTPDKSPLLISKYNPSDIVKIYKSVQNNLRANDDDG